MYFLEKNINIEHFFRGVHLQQCVVHLLLVADPRGDSGDGVRPGPVPVQGGDGGDEAAVGLLGGEGGEVGGEDAAVEAEGQGRDSGVGVE